MLAYVIYIYEVVWKIFFFLKMVKTSVIRMSRHFLKKIINLPLRNFPITASFQEPLLHPTSATYLNCQVKTVKITAGAASHIFLTGLSQYSEKDFLKWKFYFAIVRLSTVV